MKFALIFFLLFTIFSTESERNKANLQLVMQKVEEDLVERGDVETKRLNPREKKLSDEAEAHLEPKEALEKREEKVATKEGILGALEEKRKKNLQQLKQYVQDLHLQEETLQKREEIVLAAEMKLEWREKKLQQEQEKFHEQKESLHQKYIQSNQRDLEKLKKKLIKIEKHVEELKKQEETLQKREKIVIVAEEKVARQLEKLEAAFQKLEETLQKPEEFVKAVHLRVQKFQEEQAILHGEKEKGQFREKTKGKVRKESKMLGWMQHDGSSATDWYSKKIIRAYTEVLRAQEARLKQKNEKM